MAFDYSQDARAEIGRFLRDTGIVIHASTVTDILEDRTADKLI